MSAWEADYVILGAGSAGCVLANRLSADPRVSVLLVERGGDPHGLFLSMPLASTKLAADPRLMTYYETEMGDGSPGPLWLRGRMLGGSSAVNGMIYLRGHPDDYDGWVRGGATGWGWDEMRRCFREMEDHALGADDLRGAGGPLGVSVQTTRHPGVLAMLDAGAQMGLPVREDLNREDAQGIGFTPRTVRHGRRVSAATAFLDPIRHRPNLRIETGVEAHRLIMEGRSVTGALCRRGAEDIIVRARRDVILSLGAIESPKLLQLSGIGPAAMLADAGVPVAHDLPGVGRNLREHKLATLQFRLNRRWSNNHRLRGWRVAGHGLRYLLRRDGLLSGTFDLNALVQVLPEGDRPDTQMTFTAISREMDAPDLVLEREPGIQVFAYPMRPKSRGTLHIRSPDPRDPPLIRPNFLDHPYDRQVSVAMIRYLRRLFAQPALAGIVTEESYPGTAVGDDPDAIVAFCATRDSCAHAVGTCRMGAADDGNAVVDPDLRVRGLDGLRVVDCSVIPAQMSGNTNAPVLATAWRAAERIGGQARLRLHQEADPA